VATRAICKGSLKIGEGSLPVKLYAAIEDRSIRLHVLEKDTMTRITQHFVDPETDKEVPRDQIRKGYEIERGVYVLLTDEDLQQAQPQDSRDIEVTRFVPAARACCQRRSTPMAANSWAG
jgi:DNA end-binding protein Ku